MENTCVYKFQYWLKTNRTRLQVRAINSRKPIALLYENIFQQKEALDCLVMRGLHSLNSCLCVSNSELLQFIINNKLDDNRVHYLCTFEEMNKLNLESYSEILFIGEYNIDIILSVKNINSNVSFSIHHKHNISHFENNKIFELEENFFPPFEIFDFARSFLPNDSNWNRIDFLNKLRTNNSGSDKPLIFKTDSFQKELEIIQEEILEINPSDNIAILLPYGSSKDNFDFSVEKYYQNLKNRYECSKYYKGIKLTKLCNIVITTFEDFQYLDFDIVVMPSFNTTKKLVDKEIIFTAMCSATNQLYLLNKNNKNIIENNEDFDLNKRIKIIDLASELNDIETIELQVHKLLKVSIYNELDSLLKDVLENSHGLNGLLEKNAYENYKEFIVKIKKYMGSSSNKKTYNKKALIDTYSKLDTLENELNILEKEKTKYIDTVYEFNQKFNSQLGDVIKKILYLRKEIALYNNDTADLELQEYNDFLKVLSELTKEKEVSARESLGVLDEKNYTRMNDVFTLQERMKNLERNIADIKNDISVIKSDDKYLMINSITNIDAYIIDLKKQLETVLSDLLKIQETKIMEEWIDRLWIWADNNNIPNLKWTSNDEFKSGGYWSGLPRNKEKLLQLQELTILVYIEELPNEISNLMHLKELYLVCDDLVYLPNSIISLVDLDNLILKNNTELMLTYSQLTWINTLKSLGCKVSIDEKLNTFENEWEDNIFRWAIDNNVVHDFYNIKDMKNLTDLDISNNNLTELPKEIGYMQNLTELILSNNNLVQLPEEILNLKNLEYIEIDGNENLVLSVSQKIFCISRDLLYNSKNYEVNTDDLVSITNVDLSNLNLEGEIPSIIYSCVNLQELKCFYSGLLVLGKDIGNLKNLKTLEIGMNEITILPDEITELTKLNFLQLHGNPLELTLEQEKWIGSLREKGCIITLDDIEKRKNYPKLFDIIDKEERIEAWIKDLWQWADKNNISSTQLSRKKENLISTKTIDFTGIGLDNIPDEICNLKNLTTLVLWDNNLVYLPEKIINFKHLKKLNLRGNPNLLITLDQKKWLDELRLYHNVFIDNIGLIDEEEYRGLKQFRDNNKSIDEEKLIDLVIQWVVDEFKKLYKKDITQFPKSYLRINDEAKRVGKELLRKGNTDINLAFLAGTYHFRKENITLDMFITTSSEEYLTAIKSVSIPTMTDNKESINKKVEVENSAYSQKINSITTPNFEKIRRVSANYMGSIGDETKVNYQKKFYSYMADNGKRDKALLYSAFDTFLMNLDGKTINIVDWECGQGMTSMLLIDYIREKQLNIDVLEIYLVDTDAFAVSRAKAHIDVLKNDDTYISVVNNDSVNVNDLQNIQTDIDATVFLNLNGSTEAYFNIIKNEDGLDFILPIYYVLLNTKEHDIYADRIYNFFKGDLMDVNSISARSNKIGRFQRFEQIFSVDL